MTAHSPGRPLRPRSGSREPGASEILLPHGEDHSEAACITAVRGVMEPGRERDGGKTREGERASRPPPASAPRDPSVKRTLCRGCSSLLIPGLTCTQRQRREYSLLLRWDV